MKNPPPVEKFFVTISRIKVFTGFFGFFMLCLILPTSCRKDFLVSNKKSHQSAMSAKSQIVQINLKDVYAKLPQTILYNLGDSAVFYVSRSTYSYVDSYLVVHIPTSLDSLNYIYAAKSVLDPSQTLVFAVKLLPDPGSSMSNFSGKKEWINFQNGTAYGLKYQNNEVVAYSQPTVLFSPGWEECMIDHHDFLIDDNGKIIVNPNLDTGNVAMREPKDLRCPNTGGGFWASLGRFFSGIGHAIGGLFDGGGGSGGDPGGNWSGSGWWSNWTSVPPFTPGPSLPPSFPPGYGSPPGGGGGGGTPPTNPPGDNPPDTSSTPVVTTPSNAVAHTTTSPAYSVNNPNHGPNPGISPLISYDGNVIGIGSANQIGGGRDANGFYYSRITALKIYLQAHPYGMIDCGDMGNLPSEVHQEVGDYQIPQSVTDRIDSIRNAFSPQYNQNNFYIQKIQDAHGGVVNCDYFPVHITQLPQINGQTMTPLEFLEYFRTNINFIIGLGGQGGSSGVHFFAYHDYNVNFYDSRYYGTSYGASLGGLIHISIGPVFDNGTIIESGYQTTSSSGNYWFMVTTMYSPVDDAHPVAGNRRFGIKPDPNGGYTLYTMGVDRTYDWSTTILNVTTGVAFSSADALWNAVQDGVISDVNSSGGQASLYTPRQQYARPKWNKVKDFLEGHITLQQLKNELNCP